MFLEGNRNGGESTPSIMDSPTLARVERALQRQEGKNVFCCQPNLLAGHAIQRGLLWQQRDRLFSRWKERYFILTRDYLHCFRKASDNGTDRISDMGTFIFKVKLVDVERVEWMNKKNYSAICLDLGRDGKILLRSAQRLEDWFDLLEEYTLASKERRKALRHSHDAYRRGSRENDDLHSIHSTMDEWRKIGLADASNDSDSIPEVSSLDLPSLPSLHNSVTTESRSGDEDDRWNLNINSGMANPRLSLLTDIDINALETPPPSLRDLRASATPCRLNSDVFFLPGLNHARQRSSFAGHGSFRVPNMLQTTRGTANRYSLVDEPDSLLVPSDFIYSTYDNKRGNFGVRRS